MFEHHVLRREQRLPGSPAEVFPFFADAGNLEAITPPWLRFEVVTPRPIEMRPGALIEYRLVLHRLPIAWLTRIEEWEPGVRFVDMQLTGPYRLWHHTHEFRAAPGRRHRDDRHGPLRAPARAARRPRAPCAGAQGRRADLRLPGAGRARARQLTVSLPSMPAPRWLPTGQ